MKKKRVREGHLTYEQSVAVIQSWGMYRDYYWMTTDDVRGLLGRNKKSQVNWILQRMLDDGKLDTRSHNDGLATYVFYRRRDSIVRKAWRTISNEEAGVPSTWRPL